MSAAEIYARFPQLETENLILRRLSDTDAPAVLRIFGDDTVTHYYDLDTFTDLAQAEELIERFERRFAHQIGIRWGLARKSAPDEIIGTCGYNIWIQDHDRAVVGYDLARTYWRRGIMSEALRQVVHFGFVEMGLNRIETPVFQDNAASRRLLEKLGFCEEGVLREYEFLKGRFIDLAMYSLLKKDWREIVSRT